MPYFHWDETTVSDFSPHFISEMYEKGYVFTRIGKGVMQQTRSLRVDLDKFDLTSENRRVLKKTDAVQLTSRTLPLSDYDFKLGKMAKDFYDAKFGPGIMSAQKVKEMLTDPEKSNFNILLVFSLKSGSKAALGQAICYSNDSILHYSYPFYELNESPKDMGLGMMTMAIQFAKEKGLRYLYLGSLQRPSDTYKLQFEGLEWFDGKEWRNNLDEVKEILDSVKIYK